MTAVVAKDAVAVGDAVAAAALDDRTAWIEPATELVAPGVYRVPLPLPTDGLRAVNVYVIVDGDSLVMVDAGWALAVSERRLDEALSTLGFALGDVHRFLITHVHRDHYTQAVALRRRFGGRILLGAGERATLESIITPKPRADGPFSGPLARAGATELAEGIRRAHGGPRSAEEAEGFQWEAPDEWIDGVTDIGLTTRTLRAVPTPGHTPGHLVYADVANGLLFAGDHVLPHITPSIGFVSEPGPLPLRDFLDSLALVRRMPNATLLPAHGPVRAGGVHPRVEELLAHHAERLDAAVVAVKAGAATGHEVSRALTWTRRERHLDDLDRGNQMLAVMETVAHLELLVSLGRLVSEDSDGVRRYALPAAPAKPSATPEPTDGR